MPSRVRRLRRTLLAAGCDDATKCARVLVEAADRSCNEHRDRLGVLTAVRWRLAGVIDAQPDDLVPIVALGLAELAALEPAPEVEARREVTLTMGRGVATTAAASPGGSATRPGGTVP